MRFGTHGPENCGGSVRLDPGECLFLYTDGVPEANNAALDDFTDKRLMEVLGESAGLATREIIQAVTAQLLAFTAGASQSDDITMMAMRRAIE